MKSPLGTLLLLMTVLAVGCKKEEDAPTPIFMGTEYFPDKEGIERIYLVDSIAWDEFTNSVDSFRYYYKEKITAHYFNNEGNKTQRIEQFLYDSTAGAWVIWKVQAANLKTTTAEVIEDNYRFIKLIFPLKSNSFWNGNAYNPLGEQRYKVTSLNQPTTTSFLTFDSTATVLQQDDFTLIYDRFAEEKYAIKIGLFQRTVTDVTTNPSNLQIIGGYKYIARLVSFTKP
jgi:hypothetical protein